MDTNESYLLIYINYLNLIEFINYERPGFLNNKTKIKWNIDLQAPQSISGRKYKKMAEDLHMDGTIHSH